MQQISHYTEDGTTDWKAFFLQFPAIFLIANSEQANLREAFKSAPPDSLFVFFNKTHRVMKSPFKGHSILIVRSGRDGASIVKRGAVHHVTKNLASPAFHGIVNLTATETERFSPVDAFEGHDAFHLNRWPALRDFYPAGLAASSGFAIALWLVEMELPMPIELVGFTAVRSSGFRIFEIHDWTFEQTVLRLFYAHNKLHRFGFTYADQRWTEAICERFDFAQPAEVALIGQQVLAYRLESTNDYVDRLWSLSRPYRALYTIISFFKPRYWRSRRLAKERERARQL